MLSCEVESTNSALAEMQSEIIRNFGIALPKTSRHVRLIIYNYLQKELDV